MQNFPQNIPSSVRALPQTSRFAQSLSARGQRPQSIAGPTVRTSMYAKSRFTRLPHEPEDARITGVTRSLHRRLLALNLRGSLAPEQVLAKTLIA